MTIAADFVVVGAGMTGATIARRLADAGREVVVLERRSHVGGNVHDHDHASGVRIHTYGPHQFRTNSDRLWEWAQRFGAIRPFRARVMSRANGHLVAWPLGASTLRRLAGDDWTPAFAGRPTNFEEAALALMPRVVYETFVKEYNEKQWGIPARTLAADLCRRFDVRLDDDPFLTPDRRHQGIPGEGYATWTRRMLDGIECRLGFDFLERRGEVEARRLLVYTGPIDAWFGHDLGRLAYRGQRREHRHLPDVTSRSPAPR